MFAKKIFDLDSEKFHICLKTRSSTVADKARHRPITKYFDKSLKVTENGTIQNFGYVFLFAFHGRICNRFDTLHECDRQTDRQRTTA